MTLQEVGFLLAMIGQYEPTLLPAAEEDVQFKAAAWHRVLAPLPFKDGEAAVLEFYRKSQGSIAPADILKVARGTQATAPNRQEFTTCNPQILDPKNDLEGRYEIFCARCGPNVSQYADTYDAAVDARDLHQPIPHKKQTTSKPVDAGYDWSEPRREG